MATCLSLYFKISHFILERNNGKSNIFCCWMNEDFQVIIMILLPVYPDPWLEWGYNRLESRHLVAGCEKKAFLADRLFHM